jgi:hypothetical protein
MAETTLRRILAVADKKVSRAAFGGSLLSWTGIAHGEAYGWLQQRLDEINKRKRAPAEADAPG